MNPYQECLHIIEENRINPRTLLYFLTMCLKHWSENLNYALKLLDKI